MSNGWQLPFGEVGNKRFKKLKREKEERKKGENCTKNRVKGCKLPIFELETLEIKKKRLRNYRKRIKKSFGAEKAYLKGDGMARD